MSYPPARHHRRSIRLRGYDYARDAAYYVTVCTHEREEIFGEVVGVEMCLSDFGRVVEGVWRELPVHFPRVVLDGFVVMPNHLHGVVVIAAEGDEEVGGGDGAVGARHASPLRGERDGAVGARHASPLRGREAGGGEEGVGARHASPSLGTVVGAFKSAVARAINRLRETPGAPVWQRNYYEHIVRGDEDLERIRRYIDENPARWAFDPENPRGARGDGAVGARHASPLRGEGDGAVEFACEEAVGARHASPLRGEAVPASDSWNEKRDVGKDDV